MATSNNARDAADVIAPPPLIYLGGLAAGFALEAALPSAPVPGAVRWGLGGALVVSGVAMARGFFRALAGAGTTTSPYSPSTTLVTSGPYRLTRNPGYLAMALAYAGTGLLAGAVWPFVTLLPTVALIDFGVIRREERYLGRAFGAEYHDYCARTRRWL